MAGPSDERALASLLAASGDEELAQLFAARKLPPSTPAQDFFDVAATLLSDASVDRALTRLAAPELAALASAQTGPVAAPLRSALASRALLDADGVPFQTVRSRLAERAGSEAFTSPAVVPLVPADPQSVAAAAERAFEQVASLADILLAAASAPLSRTGAGAISATERRRLIDDGAVASAEQLEDLIVLGAYAGLLSDEDRSWQATDAAPEWLDEGTSERWGEVASAYVRALPEALRTAEGGFLPPPVWPGVYRLDPEWPGQAAALVRRGVLWGVLTDEGLLPWTAQLSSTGEVDTRTLTAALPPEVDKIYLQADLSAISPGPLAPRLEQRLRRMATRETRAQASTYRFTAESLTAAMSGGESAESVHAFLAEISLTGIPQPLAYLIDATAARHGAVRVGMDAATGRTVVRSSSPQLLATIAVDQSLRPVGLVKHEGALVSRAGRDAVYWSLVDARYPVVAVDENDHLERVLRRSMRQAASEQPPREQYRELIAALRGAQSGDADAAWLERELEQAVRARATIDVTVSLPDGSTRVFALEATGLGGGRLRGLDRAADVERTLPMTSIVSVSPR
ncbi:helicase-associated domain-containing protein [Microbacterium neimengense]